jgi:hypothetical protein
VIAAAVRRAMMLREARAYAGAPAGRRILGHIEQ